MTLRQYRYFQALALIFLGIFLLEKIISGKLIWYINQRFIPLTIMAVVALIAIGQSVFREARRIPAHDLHENEDHSEHDHDHAPSGWRLAIIIIPLIFGILIPAQPLTADAMSSKGVSSSAQAIAGSSNAVKFDQAADERNILDWIRLFNSQEVSSESYLGQEANVIGFVYHDPRLKDGQFLVSRFAVVCCTADAFAIGMVVDWPESASLPSNQWIKVKGPVQTTELSDQKMPLIQATSVESVQMPDQPYLFP